MDEYQLAEMYVHVELADDLRAAVQDSGPPTVTDRPAADTELSRVEDEPAGASS